MRKLNGIEVPEWFIPQRAPFVRTEPTKRKLVEVSEVSFNKTEVSLEEILSTVPKERHDKPELIFINGYGSYDGCDEVCVSWYDEIDDPEYESNLAKYNEEKERNRIWCELREKIGDKF